MFPPMDIDFVLAGFVPAGWTVGAFWPKPSGLMSALGKKRRLDLLPVTLGLPQASDISLHRTSRRCVPEAATSFSR
jgi:hypothetical protein